MKTIFITGSTDGIGKLAAIKFARGGHDIVVHGRTKVKLDNAITEIEKEASSDRVRGYVADLSDLEAVVRMVKHMNQDLEKIDVLINNAGVYKGGLFENNDVLDIRMMVNYLAPFLLTEKLLPLLQKGTRSRIINLSSAAQAPVSLEVLQGKEKVSDGEAYAQSKLALTMWSFYLSQMHQEISVIAVNPGSLLNTKMAQEAFGQSWAEADKGADILFELATKENYQSRSGEYFDNDKGDFARAHEDSYNEEKISNLIRITEELIK